MSNSNRILKFRVWDGKRDRWLHSTDHAIHLFGEVIAMGEIFACTDDNYHCPLEDINTLIPTQFIGRDSFDGKPIYEGDIVRVEIDDTFEEVTKTALVVWNNSCAAYYYDFGSVSMPVMDDRITDPVIIGNMYENPELLENE